jgi:hypothetical protein
MFRARAASQASSRWAKRAGAISLLCALTSEGFGTIRSRRSNATGWRQSITAWAASSRETGAADFVERMSASSGKAQSATKVMNRKLLE